MNDEPLVLGRDYIIEEGKWVFLAEYLRRRGYCCQNGCRHCPYGFDPKATSPNASDAPNISNFPP